MICSRFPLAIGRRSNRRSAPPFLILVLGLVTLAPGASVAETSTTDNVDALHGPAVVGLGPTVDQLTRFAGAWDQAPDERANADRLENIDAAIAELSWIVRKMAGGVLRDSTTPPPEVRFTWDGGRLAQHLEIDGEMRVRPIEFAVSDLEFDTNVVDRRDPGVPSRWAWLEDRLEVQWMHDQARGFTRFRYEPSDDSLHVAYEIHVTALDGVEPIRYVSRFTRRAPPNVAAAPESVQVSGTLPGSLSETE